MGASDKTTSFRIDVEGNARQYSAETTDSMRELADKITSAMAVTKQLAAAQRSLKGSSEEVKAAKEKLSAAIDQERRGIESANIALLKQGAAYERLVAEQKAAEREADKLAKKQQQAAQNAALKELTAIRSSLSAIGGPLGEAANKFEALSGVLKGVNGSFGVLKLGAIATVASVLAVTAAIVGATVALVGWIARSADLNRSQQLVREGMAGTAQNAANLGTQVAALAAKVATPTAELNAMSTELLNVGLNGQQVVDTMNAIAQAGSAAGPKVAGAIEEWITRGARWQRMSLNPLEMQRTGIKFQDVAAEYAKQTGIGIQKARMRLISGAASLGPAAAALRTVVEKQFGAINARKMLQLDQITATFGKHLQTLTTGVDFERIAKPLGEIMKLFDASTVTGAAMKDIITNIGKAMGDVFAGGVPSIKGFVETLTIAALETEIHMLELRNAIRDSFAGPLIAQIDPFKTALGAVGVVAATAAVGMGAFAVATISVWGPIVAIGMAITGALYYLKKFYDYAAGVDWSYLGTAIGDGIVNGIKATIERVKAAVSSVVDVIKSTFTGAQGMDIHSPSRVSREWGRRIDDGTESGIRDNAGNVQSAVSDMVPQGPGGGGRGAAGAGSALPEVHIHLHGVKDGADAVNRLSAPSFLSSLSHAFETMAASAGIASQATVTP